MTGAPEYESIIEHATEQENKYSWREAVSSYRKALGVLPKKDLSHAGNIYELLGRALFQSALQAENNPKFRAECAAAIENYRNARNCYTEASSNGNTPRILHCGAMIAYLDSWLASGLPERKRLLDEACMLMKESLGEFFETGEAWEYVKGFNQLSAIAAFGCALEQDYQMKKQKTKEAVELGEQAIVFLASRNHPRELAQAYVETAVFLGCFGYYFLGLPERETYNQKASNYMKKAMKLSEHSALLQLLDSVPLSPSGFWGVGTDRTLENLSKALEYAKMTRNRFLIGCAFDWLAFNSFWKAMAGEDSAETLKLVKESLQYADKAKAEYSVLNFVSPRGYSFCIETARADYYVELAVLATDLSRKRDLSRKAVNAARHGLKVVEGSGCPETVRSARHALGKALTSLASAEVDRQKKRRLLEEALKLGEEVRKLTEQMTPFHYWDLGFMLKYLVDTKLEVAELAQNPETRNKLLQEAILDKETSIALATRYAAFYEKAGSVPVVARVEHWQREYGDLLYRLYESTHNVEGLRKAAGVYEDAAERFQKLTMMSRAAECFWKAAQAHDRLGEHLKAAEDFDDASNTFHDAAERIPQLTSFYHDNASYMQAWSEIERAKNCHRKQECGLAKRHFEKAAGLHKTLVEWRYLAPNYLAWAKMEHAEELSREERCSEAIQAFKKAASLFAETEKSIQKKLDKIENKDEKQMAIDLLEASDLRHKYCTIRVSVEKAKTLCKSGEHYSSAQEYGSVAETIETMVAALKSQQETRELDFIAALCRAWQKMMLAEDRDMPALYAESAQLFEKASEHSSSDSTRFLALGHNWFCRALEAGIRFLDTQEMGTYSSAMQYLQNASRYYKMAGLKNDAEHAKATELLFEAYAHVNNAKKQIDPEKKVKLYRMAEVILQASSERYVRAKRPEKRNEVLRLLKTIREEQEWAMSCAQVLRTSSLISATYFPASAPMSERAVGLNRFEHADVQAYLSAPKEAAMGDMLNIRLDLVNVSKNSGLLIRVEQLVPAGLKVVSSDPQLNIEDRSLDLNGKRLEPLKVESVKITARAVEPGLIKLSPKVVFVDDIGNFKTYRPKAVRVIVNPMKPFEFEVKSAEAVLSFLAASFLEDHEKRKMPPDKCGWRSLGNVMKRGMVSRSSVYGVSGGRGQAIIELEKLGLIEARVFSGERGRGGSIPKVRVHYEKETVKRYLNQKRQIIRG